jgi:hypothetical protein
VECLFVPKEIIELFLEQLVRHALIIFAPDVQFRPQTVPKTASEFPELLGCVSQETFSADKIKRVVLFRRQKIGVALRLSIGTETGPPIGVQ